MWYMGVANNLGQGNRQWRLETLFKEGSSVYVYDEQGHYLFAKTTGSGSSDGLAGYTGSSVSVRVGNVVKTYDDKGHFLRQTTVR
jgi:hypothetical protein